MPVEADSRAGGWTGPPSDEERASFRLEAEHDSQIVPGTEVQECPMLGGGGPRGRDHVPRRKERERQVRAAPRPVPPEPGPDRTPGHVRGPARLPAPPLREGARPGAGGTPDHRHLRARRRRPAGGRGGAWSGGARLADRDGFPGHTRTSSSWSSTVPERGPKKGTRAPKGRVARTSSTARRGRRSKGRTRCSRSCARPAGGPCRRPRRTGKVPGPGSGGRSRRSSPRSSSSTSTT